MNAARVAKNTLVLYFRMLGVMLVGLFTSRIQLRALGVSDFGLFQVAMATISMFCFMNGSLGMASSRFLTVEMGRGTVGSLKKVFSTVLMAHFALAALIVILLESIGLFLLQSKLNIDPSRIFAVKWAYQCSVFTTFLSITQVPYTAVIISHERMSAFAYMTFYDVGVKLLIVCLLLYSPFDRLILYATLLALSSCTSIFIYRFYCVRHFTEARFRRNADVKLLRPIFTFVGWQLMSCFIITLSSQGLVMLNQKFFGPTLVAAHSLAVTVNGHLQGFISNFKTAANPQIIKLFAAKKFDDAKTLLIETIVFSSFLLFSLGVPLWFYAPEALHIWLGSNVPEYTVGLLRIVMIGSIAMLFDSSFFTIIYADGRMMVNTLCDLFSFGSTFCLSCLLIYFTRNPYSAALTLGLAMSMQAFLQKPILLHFVAGYGIRDYAHVFVPSGLALVLSSAATYVIRFFAQGICWAIPACALAVFVNVVLLFTLVASSQVQGQMVSLLGRFGPFGRKFSGYASRYFASMSKIRSRLSVLGS